MMRLIKPGAVYIVCMLCSAAGFAQILKGRVTDSLGVVIPYANVNLKSKGNIIIAYTSTDVKGNYALPIPADADKANLFIEAGSLGFKKQIMQVTNASAVYDFKLATSVSQLKAVTIKDKNPRLRVHGDTTDYKVSEFSSPQDRVIGDVIKKLPGIDVAKDGRISYNGKAISGLCYQYHSQWRGR
jgi:hypothetical protein